MCNQISIRRYVNADATQVQTLFIKVNRLLAPVGLKDAFETYIDISLHEEVNRISEYYQEKGGSFWVALIDTKIVGMFGLERSGPDAMELRRMYVDPDLRRKGIGRMLLQFAESYCRSHKLHQLDLSTSETQPEALSLYRKSGYELVREEIVEAASNKTIGGGIRRFYFRKEV